MFTVKQLLAAAALAGLAQAKTHTVTAKSDSFDPDTVKAAKGDTIEFRFEGNHSIVAGDYRYPCSALDVGTSFYSGFNDDKASTNPHSNDTPSRGLGIGRTSANMKNRTRSGASPSTPPTPRSSTRPGTTSAPTA